MSHSLDNYKIRCELLGHSMDVRSVAPGANQLEGGQMIVSGSRDKTTKLWKPMDESYIESVTLQDHANFVSCVFYCERESWLCTGSNDATVCIYQENSLVPILTLKGHESTVCSIAAGVEPQSLVTGSWDKTARIWSIDPAGNITFVELKGHEAAVWAVASVLKSKQFVTGSADKNIFYWNAKGEKLRMLKGHTDCVRGILALSNGGLISCANDAIIRVWNDDGECVQQMSGHTNYIYAIAQQKVLGNDCIVSCGEDSSLRMWNISKGIEVGSPLLHPAQSVWSVACLSNGDIVTGSSDGVVRVFTKDPQRMAKEPVLKAYQLAVETRKQQMSEELGGIKKTDLPGPEALLTNGTREGQTKMVRHQDGSVKCYSWELGKWNLVGDVTGASGGSQASSGKTLYEGNEYDYVFSVDISDTEPALKLPYNRGEDPWHSAQAFIHRNNLPQVYLDQVANFIIKNSDSAPVQASTTTGINQLPTLKSLTNNMSHSLDNYKIRCELLGHSMDVRSVAPGANQLEGGQMIVSGSRDKTTKLWKPMDESYIESVTLQDHANFVSCVFYCERERWLCTGSNDATVCIYQENSLVPILTLKGHESTVCSIAAGVEPQSLVTGSWDKTARIWSIDPAGNITFVELKGHEAAVWAVASVLKSKQFVTGSADKNIFYWNAKGEKLRMLKGHTDCVRGILALSNGGLISCANDAIIRVWNDDGECVQQMSGHTNYIYAIAQQKVLGNDCIVSCGEDSSLRMWNISKGIEVGSPLLHPAQSVWSVACLSNGDIVTGSSDGVVRVFTKDPQRMAKEPVLKAYQLAVETRKQQMSEELGGIKKTDLPGPEALLTNGTREGQTKMVRHQDGSVKCYSWELGKWNLVGDVTGASGGSQASSGKTLYEGNEYDYVFSVDISDTEPALKLPYNRGEDPWHSAQAFIHRNNLPQVYLDQVANFIIKNSDSAPVQASTTTGGFQDPFTGGNRYVPGSSNTNFQTQAKVDVNFVKGEKHFPVSQYLTFDNCDPSKVLEKLKEFNNKLPTTNEKVSNNLLESVVRLADSNADVDKTAIEALQILLRWPSELLFPVIDIVRLAVRNEAVFSVLNATNFLDALLQHITTSAPNQLMILRCLANIMKHEAGRQQVDKRLTLLIEYINGIKSGSNNLQIAIATFYLNATITQTKAVANGEKCRLVAEGLVEFLKWSNDLEACYRSIQAIGNLTTTPFGQEVSALVISVDYVMDKLRELTNTPQAGNFAKINSAGTALLAAF